MLSCGPSVEQDSGYILCGDLKKSGTLGATPYQQHGANLQ